MELEGITKILENDLSELESRLKVRSKTGVELINKLSEHIISSGGKRLRPILLFLAAHLGDKSLSSKTIDASVIVEFIHAATLLHDDVVDMSEIRHSQDTANSIWGNKGAVLVGDFLYSRAFEIIVEINNTKIYETLALTTNTIAQGEVMQLMNIKNIRLSEKEYMEIIYRKTAILFEASAKIGSIIGNNNSENIEKLSKFGLHLGLAYQLRNDFLDYFGDSSSTGKNLAEDLTEGKVTVPIIHSLNNSNKKEKLVIEKAISENDTSLIESIIDILRKNKSDIYIQEKITQQTDIALSHLSTLPKCIYKEKLMELALFCQDRSK